MNKLTFDIFEGMCEPYRLEYDGSLVAKITIYPPKDGYILLSDVSLKVEGGKCTAELKTLPDGSYTPCFYTDDMMYSMPALTKKGRMLRLEAPDDDFIYRIAARGRFAARRIYELECKLTELQEKIDGARLSIGDQASQ